MHSSTAFALLSAGAALAAPAPSSNSPFHGLTSKSTSAITGIALPSSSLPMPDASLMLKYVAVGLGTQNYTCTASPGDMSTAPVSVGAVANLYDATPVLSMDPSMVSSLPALALQMLQSMNMTPDQLPGNVKMPQIGRHFFAAGLVPNFILSSATPAAQIAAKKTADVPAPTSSCPNTSGAGAVDWLQLVDNGMGVSNGTPLQGGDVYRVETAGGDAPATCVDNTGDIESQYAALYYFYGPATAASSS